MHPIQKYTAIGGFVAIVACWPLAVGQIAQTQIHKNFDQFKNDVVQVDLESYHRGYLSSDAVSKVTIIDPALEADFKDSDIPTQFTFHHHITHGLWSVNSENKLENQPDYPIDITSKTYFNGTTKLKFKNEAFDQKFADETTTKLKASYLNLVLAHSGNISFDYEINGLEITDGQESLTSGQLKGEGEGQRILGSWIGNQSFTLDHLAFKQNDSERASLADLVYQYSANIDKKEQDLSNAQKMTLASLDYQGQQFQDVDFDFNIEGLKADSFGHLVEAMQNPDETNIQAMLPEVEAILKHGLKISINAFDMKLTEGKVKNKIELSLPKNKDASLNAPFKLLKDLHANVDMLVSEELVTQYPELKPNFDKLINLKVMEKGSKGYTIQAKLEDNNFIFKSGEKIPLTMLPLIL